MVLLSATRRGWLLEDFGSVMVLIMMTPSAQLLNRLPSGFFSLLQLLGDGFFVSLMCRMLFCMVSWRRRSICGSHQGSLILIVLIICVVLRKHSMV